MCPRLEWLRGEKLLNSFDLAYKHTAGVGPKPPRLVSDVMAVLGLELPFLGEGVGMLQGALPGSAPNEEPFDAAIDCLFDHTRER